MGARAPGSAGLPSRRVKVFICVYLAVQLLAPLWYYTGRDDAHDERFAWRMFSSMRMLQCQVTFETGAERARVADLGTRFHEAWLTLTRRGRVDVIVAMAKKLCADGADEVYAGYVCKSIDGAVEERGGTWNLCRLDSL